MIVNFSVIPHARSLVAFMLLNVPKWMTLLLREEEGSHSTC